MKKYIVVRCETQYSIAATKSEGWDTDHVILSEHSNKKDAIVVAKTMAILEGRRFKDWTHYEG